MEQTATSGVSSAPQRLDDPRKRRSPSSMSARLGMANALAPLVSRMSTEQVRQALGDCQGNVG